MSILKSSRLGAGGEQQGNDHERYHWGDQSMIGRDYEVTPDGRVFSITSNWRELLVLHAFSLKGCDRPALDGFVETNHSSMRPTTASRSMEFGLAVEAKP